MLGKYNYRLRNGIVHNEAPTSSSHYYSGIIYTDGANQYYVTCDDKSVTSGSSFPPGVDQTVTFFCKTV